MFFSDDLLTSKKGSFGIIWLMATLGPRGKKMTRKQITGVDLSKTCDLIAQPVEPMALRLSGALLVGVARVYNQNIEIFYSDVTNFHSTLRRSIMTDFAINDSGTGGASSTAGMDLPGGGKSRPEMITFGGTDFELGLDYEFRHIDWNDPLQHKRKRRASSLLPSQQTQSSQDEDDDDDDDDSEDDNDEDGPEAGRGHKRKKSTASPIGAGPGNTKTRMSIHHPSDNLAPDLYSHLDVPFGETVDLELNLDGAFNGGDDSFSGPSGRGFQLPDEGAVGEEMDMGFNMVEMRELPIGSREGTAALGDRGDREASVPSPLKSALKKPNPREGSQEGSVEDVENVVQPPKERIKKVKRVKFDANVELDQEEDREARRRYRKDMEQGHRELAAREREKQVGAQVAAMFDNGGGGLQFFDVEMNDFLADITTVGKFKWELDVAAARQGTKVSDEDNEDQEIHQNQFEQQQDDGFGLSLMQEENMMPDFGSYQEQYQDFSVPVRGSSRRQGSEAVDVEVARRASQQSQQSALPWDAPARGGDLTPGFGDGVDQSFSSPSLRLSVMTPQEARIRLNSRTGSGKGSDTTGTQRQNRYRSNSLLSDRANDDPLLLTTAGVDELELPVNEAMEIGSLGQSQQERLRDLPAAFRPEMLAALEKQCRDFFTYVERKILTLDVDEVDFNDIVSSGSNKHVAALAFYDCLTLATKKIFSVSQPEPWETINVRFAVMTL